MENRSSEEPINKGNGFDRSAIDYLIKFADEIIETHVSLFDGTNEGIKHKTLPIFSVQYHPRCTR